MYFIHISKIVSPNSLRYKLKWPVSWDRNQCRDKDIKCLAMIWSVGKYIKSQGYLCVWQDLYLCLQFVYILFQMWDKSDFRFHWHLFTPIFHLCLLFLLNPSVFFDRQTLFIASTWRKCRIPTWIAEEKWKAYLLCHSKKLLFSWSFKL